MNNHLAPSASVTSSAISSAWRRSEEVRRRSGVGKSTNLLLPTYREGGGGGRGTTTPTLRVIRNGMNDSWENENSPGKCGKHLPGPNPTNRLNRSEGYLMVPTHEIPERTATRAAKFVSPNADGCHVSFYKTDKDGYSRITFTDPTGKQRSTGAHRASWVATHGQIEDGMVVDHLCKNRQCVNVEHLRLLSHADNSRRTFNRDWPLGQCANGHPDTERVTRSGKSMCRICDNEKHYRYQAKKNQTQ